METIVEPNDLFDFSKISLAHPVGIQGGAYFTKIEFNKKPLYIQTSKSLTRQGFVKTGKKYYCDLMFDKNSESIIHWFENLEEKCKKLIYEKKESWFQGNLEENDIENAFNPLIRVYKSGKFYLLRVNVKNSKEDTPLVKIYNENEIALQFTDITPDIEIVSILEIQGIKFTSRNFQIDIEIKQMMVMNNEPIFDSCLIKTNKKVLDKEKDTDINQSFMSIDVIKNQKQEQNLHQDQVQKLEQKLDQDQEKMPELKESYHLEEFDPLDLLQSDTSNKEPENEHLELEFEDLSDNIEENSDTLREIHNNDLHLDKTNAESITLKKPNQVYFELYKEARIKAKQAKKNAILAYLEAKNIKKTYLIENMDDSDSDFDAEIDEVSESELEGL